MHFLAWAIGILFSPRFLKTLPLSYPINLPLGNLKSDPNICALCFYPPPQNLYYPTNKKKIKQTSLGKNPMSLKNRNHKMFLENGLDCSSLIHLLPQRKPTHKPHTLGSENTHSDLPERNDQNTIEYYY